MAKDWGGATLPARAHLAKDLRTPDILYMQNCDNSQSVVGHVSYQTKVRLLWRTGIFEYFFGMFPVPSLVTD